MRTMSRKRAIEEDDDVEESRDEVEKQENENGATKDSDVEDELGELTWQCNQIGLKRNKVSSKPTEIPREPLDLQYYVLERGLDYFVGYIPLFSKDVMHLLVQARVPSSLLDLFLFYDAVDIETMKDEIQGRVFENIYKQLTPPTKKKLDQFLQLLDAEMQ